jgi:branched-chain amino acid transport system permease protein
VRDLLQILVFAAVDGTFYALFAVGIAVLFRGTRAINFAVAELGTFSLYAYWWLSTNKGLPFFVGLLGAILVGLAITVGFDRLVIRRVPPADRTTITVASVGLLSLLLAFEGRYFGAETRRIAPPIEGTGVTVVGVTINPSVFVAVAVLLASAFALTTLLRKTDFGLGVLAVAQDRDASRLMGVPAARVSLFLWGVGAVLAVIAGYLVVPSIGNLRAGIFGGLYTKALIGAVVGGLDSIWGAVAGAYAVALIEKVVIRYVDLPALPGDEWVALLVAVLLVLTVKPTGLLAGVRIRGAA